MCTVIFEVPEQSGQNVRVLAIRDENPERPWDPPGVWWPDEHPGVIGVRDRQAGGAWLATNQKELSVILNRAECVQDLLPAGAAPLNSRGKIVLDSIAGAEIADDPHTESFNLVQLDAAEAFVTTWNGEMLQRQKMLPGVHMIAHSEVNDFEAARIKTWLPKFRELAGAPSESWHESWLKVLRDSTQLDLHDDSAIIRDNTPLGFPTKSLLISTAEIGEGSFEIRSAVLRTPAVWGGEELQKFQ